jgi:tRNA(fMet)-specific endonuclease VapC
VNGRFLLDTSAVIALFGSKRDVARILERAQQTFLPVIVLGELLHGARASARREKNEALARQFAEANTLLACDATTAEEYGRIKHELRQRGTPIPENDIWISAVAAQHGLAILSSDSHFREVEGLDVEGW